MIGLRQRVGEGRHRRPDSRRDLEMLPDTDWHGARVYLGEAT